MKKILLIATGGTIACKTTENGLTPLMSSEELLSYVEAAKSFCTVDTVQIMNIDSTNMHPDDWVKIAAKVEECYAAYDGFVIAHGTDTMAYTAAALSYLIQDSFKPIVITGSQRPIEMDVTDAKTNLLDSLRYASWSKASGVNLVFGGKVIAGTRARKMNSKSFDAFDSINFPNIAVIQDKGIVQYIKNDENHNQPVFYHTMNPRVFVLKLTPGIDSSILTLIQDKYDAFVLESYGVGGIPEGEKYNFHEVLEELMKMGKTIVLSTQTVYEGSDITVYRSGHMAKEEFGVMEAYDMTPEATVTKLMWILGQTKDPQQIRQLFNTTIANDMLSQEWEENFIDG